MLFDPRTLAITASFASAVQALAILYIWIVQLRERAVIEFAASAALIALGAGLGASRPYLPEVLTHVVAIACILGGHTLGALAFARFLRRRLAALPLISLMAVAVLSVAFFTFVAPRIDVRIAIFSLSTAVNSLLVAVLLLDVPKGPLRVTHWPVGFLHLLHGMLSIARAFMVLVVSPPVNVFEPSTVNALWFMQGLVLVDLTFTGVILMAAQRISLDLDFQGAEDSQTGAMNRRAFEDRAAAEWSRATRHDIPLSFLILDLDRFKALNDAHGYKAGDAWLKTFAGMVNGMLRREDLLCRYGGEKFLIMLPQTEIEAAVQVAERIRRAVEGLRLSHDGVQLASTVSIGVAAKSSSQPTVAAAFTAADLALYRAKAAGRNRVERG